MKSIILILVTLSCASLISSQVQFLTDVVKTCPKYSCDTDLATGTCAKASGKFSDATRAVGVKACEDKKYCPFVPKEFENDTADKTDLCKDIPTTTQKLLPGEDECTKDSDCKDVTWYDKDAKESTTGKCDTTTKKCLGSEAGIKCLNNESCTAGNYCNSEKKCATQVESGKACVETYDCKNNLICSKKLCADAYSLKVGDSLADIDALGKAFACSTGLYDPIATEPKCLEKRYKLKDGTNVGYNGLVQCDVETKCTYQKFDSSATDAKQVGADEEMDCVCGYNANGKGFCPYSQNEADKTLKGISLIKERLNNTRHTVNRSLGPKTVTEEQRCFTVSNGVNYIDAPQCVVDAAGYTGCHAGSSTEDSSDTSSTDTTDTSTTSNGFYLASSFLSMIIFALF